jgi:hypothetical protein
MMQEIADNEISLVVAELAGLVRKGLGDSRRINLMLQRPDYSRAVGPPLAVVYDTDFEAEELGFGGELGEGREEKEIALSGDGKTIKFSLPRDLLRPILSVRTKAALLTDIDDYTVSYDESLLTFRFPPVKHENVYVRYLVRRDGEDRGMRLKIRCNVDLWGADDIECNMMTLKTMKQILKSADELQTKGIRLLHHVKGETIAAANNNFTKENMSAKVGPQGKRLVYLCEINFKVNKEPGYTRIKEIHIKEKK